MSEPALVLNRVVRAFRQAQGRLEILKGAELKLSPGEMVALVGPSGAGKSTLLHIAGLLEKPDGGEVFIAGQPCTKLSDDARTRLRRHHIGFVYQYHHLLPEFSALENIVLPQMIAGLDKAEARKRARDLLDVLGLSPRESHRPGKLSGGEQQRVAIARALANAPSLMLADEPTGNLDPETAADVFAMLLKLARSANLALLIATHNTDLAARMDRTVRLEHGVLVEV